MRGRRILLTGTGGAELARLLAERGARPVAVPTIEIRLRRDPALDSALEAADSFDWIVITSAAGAAVVLDRLAALGRTPPSGPRWAAVGPRTAAALAAGGVEVAHVPETRAGAAIPDGMGELKGRRVLLARAAAAGDDLPRILRERGATVEDRAAYDTIEGPDAAAAPLARALDAGVDAAIFTSGSTVRGFLRLAGSGDALGGAAVVCIGPSTAAVAREAGMVPAAVAADPTPAGLVAALEDALAGATPTLETGS